MPVTTFTLLVETSTAFHPRIKAKFLSQAQKPSQDPGRPTLPPSCSHSPVVQVSSFFRLSTCHYPAAPAFPPGSSHDSVFLSPTSSPRKSFPRSHCLQEPLPLFPHLLFSPRKLNGKFDIIHLSSYLSLSHPVFPLPFKCKLLLWFLIPSPFSSTPPTPLPCGNHQFVFCICESLSVLFVHLFCS